MKIAIALLLLIGLFLAGFPLGRSERAGSQHRSEGKRHSQKKWITAVDFMADCLIGLKSNRPRSNLPAAAQNDIRGVRLEDKCSEHSR